MPGLFPSPRRVYGVSLSASEGAGADSWLCRATPGVGGVRVESVDTLADIPGGAVARGPALRNLLARMAEVPRSAWGIDAPFGLPTEEQAAPAAQRPPAWTALLERVAALQEYGQLASLLPERSGGATPLRVTEQEGGLQPALAADALERTFVLLREFVIPLSRQRGIGLLPFDPLPVVARGTPPAMLAGVPTIWAFEVAPARIAEQVELARTDDADTRAECLRRLVQRQWLRPMARRLRERCGGEPGAFTATLAAVIAARTSRRQDHAAIRARPRVAIEGFAYS